MDIVIDFPGGDRVDAHFGPLVVQTDQNNSEVPAPYTLFLASIGTCAGIYVLRFCQQRNIPSEGVRILQKIHRNLATKAIEKIDLEIQVPPEFPERYHSALVHTANLCAVKKTIANPPEFDVYTQVVS